MRALACFRIHVRFRLRPRFPPFICMTTLCSPITSRRRGCPLDVIREVFDRHVLIQHPEAKSRLKNLPEEYSLWTKAGGGAGRTAGGGAGKAATDAVELL